MPEIQSIYFAKDAIPEANEHGVRTLLRELRFKVYKDETFFLLVSIIDLDPLQEYRVIINFIDELSNSNMYTIDGILKVSNDKAQEEHDGFILMESISNLPQTHNNHCIVKVTLINQDKQLVASGKTILLTSSEANPYGE